MNEPVNRWYTCWYKGERPNLNLAKLYLVGTDPDGRRVVFEKGFGFYIIGDDLQLTPVEQPVADTATEISPQTWVDVQYGTKWIKAWYVGPNSDGDKVFEMDDTTLVSLPYDIPMRKQFTPASVDDVVNLFVDEFELNMKGESVRAATLTILETIGYQRLLDRYNAGEPE